MLDIHPVWPYFAMLLAALAFASLPRFRAAARSDLALCIVHLGCVRLLRASALLTYRYVEEPGMRLDKRIGNQLGAECDTRVALPATT